jgi:hypothetical protein
MACITSTTYVCTTITRTHSLLIATHIHLCCHTDSSLSNTHLHPTTAPNTNLHPQHSPAPHDRLLASLEQIRDIIVQGSHGRVGVLQGRSGECQRENSPSSARWGAARLANHRCVALYCVALCYVVLRCAVLCCVALRCVALCCVELYCDVLHCIALRCAALCCVALRCAVLCCVTLRCVALYSVAL